MVNVMIQSFTKPNKSALNALFYKQSLLDAQNDYMRSFETRDFPHFDAVILTASNEHQAEMFREQLKIRKLPPFTEYLVIPDKDGKRIGSGGATLSVIKFLKKRYGSFSGRKYAVIHSGGDSKRIPNYSAIGKLFSPVPRLLPDGNPSTLFDEFMISLASVPSRIKDGMILLSGDVMLMFNPLQIDFASHGAAAISFKESAEIGKNHGVFLADSNGNVKKFLHKQTVETLSECGAINESGNVSIDTGAVIFAPDLIEDLYSLVASSKDAERFINSKVRLSLYGDFLYPLASDSNLESFLTEASEGEFSNELKSARTEIWNAISKYNLKLLNLAPAKFVHFGTTEEVMALMNNGWKEYEYIGWSRSINSLLPDSVSGYCSIASSAANIGNGCYIEYSYVHSGATVGSNCLLSCVEIYGETIPDNIVLHRLKQRNGKFVCRIYGVNDNPKENLLFGKELSETEFGITGPLWDAEIYPECNTAGEAVRAALNVYALINGCGDYDTWAYSNKKSLCSGFNDADPAAIPDLSQKMNDYVGMEHVLRLIEERKPVYNAIKILKASSLSEAQTEWLKDKTESLDLNSAKGFYTAVRLYWYIGSALNNDELKSKAFKLISEAFVNQDSGYTFYNDSLSIKKDSVSVNLPLRVNWGGGWTDTPPYCLENGGKVLNAAVTVDGKLPVEVTITRIPKRKIIFDSRDMDAHGEFCSIEELQATGNPFDSFALQKACLIACGLIPENGGNLAAILERLGGGFEIQSEVTGIPKGSGLGTSSILAAACVKALDEFLGIGYNEDELINCVLTMEQIMSTGGGWQDQVGGLINGIKLISSEKGTSQRLSIKRISVSEKTKRELDDRFCIIYTGQRRLARNLLRDVVGRYIGNIPESVDAHTRIQVIAKKMAEALLSGNIDIFAHLMNEHWELSKMIDAETTNTLIEQIFLTIDDLIEGRFICGAGGGGFLQVILKKGISKTDIHNRLKSVFQDFPVDVWNCKIIY